MKKKIFKILFLIIIIFILISLIIFGLGYIKYKKAIGITPIKDKVAKIRNNKNYTKLANISKDYKNAVIAIEDHRFYNHTGIDILSIIRSSYVNIKNQAIESGASTITQQVSRLLYFSQEKTFTRKIAEIFVSFDLEKNYSKDEILELYLNLMYFGNGYYGIYDASYGYFDKSPKDLTFDEATYLAGLPNAPSIYSQDNTLAEERQLQVINSMQKYGYFSK